VLRDLDRLEPCGPDNPRPKLEVVGTATQARVVGAAHVKLQLDVGGRHLDCFGINLADQIDQIVGTVRVRGDLRRNTFRGVTTAELFVDSVTPT
jgi:single-stranded-DNA-specific exonuclease